MAQLVFQIWSPILRSIFELLARVLGEAKTTRYVMRRGSSEYVETDEALESIEGAMASGQVVSSRLRPHLGGVRSALVDDPRAYPDHWPLSGWLASIEYVNLDYKWLWAAILESEGLEVISLSLDEGPDFTDATLMIDTFPWDDENLILGAVRTSAGSIVRKGAAFFDPPRSPVDDNRAGM